MKRKGIVVKVQAVCLIFLMVMVMFSGIVFDSNFQEQEDKPERDFTNAIPVEPEKRGTRAVETWDWPMFHHDVYMTGAQDPSVTVPGNTVAYLFDSGGDIEAIPAVAGDWVFIGNRFGPGNDYTFYGLNETGSWFWKYTSGNTWPWSSSPAVADIPGYGLMVFSGQSYSSTSNPSFYGFDADPDDNNDGVVDGSDIDEGQVDTPGAEYDIIWTTTLAYGFGRHSPLIADIPALGGQVIYLGTNDGTVYCLDATDGSTIWTWMDPTADGFSYSHPTLAYDVNNIPMVIIINDDTGAQNTIYALDAIGSGGTTTVKWQSSLHGDEVRGGAAVEVGLPGGDDDRVYFATYSNPVTLYCYDATPDDDGSNVIGDLGDTDEGMLDLPGSTYDLIWSYDLGTGSRNLSASTPALHNNRVFIGIANMDAAYNKLFALEQNGTEDHTHVVWDYDAPGDMYWSCPAVADGKVIVTLRGYWGSAGVAVVDENNGGEIWYNTAAFSDDVETSCAVANDKIYVGGDDNILHVFGTGGFNNPPEMPILYSPEDVTIVTASEVMLDWSDSNDPNGDWVGYTVEINDTNDFISPAYMYTGVGFSHLQVTLPDGEWWWRVRAVDEFGARSDWSVIWSFTVDTVNDIPQITVISPNGGEVWSGVHMIEWTMTEPERENVTFNIWLSMNTGVTYNISLASGLGTHVRDWAFDTIPWPDGSTYRVKVEAMDARGLSNFDTSDNNFTIDHSAPIYDDWPQFMHYSNKSSQAFVDSPDTNSVAWLSIPGDPPSSIQNSPAIFNGKVFFGDHRNRFLCINETNGGLEWMYRLAATNNWVDGAAGVGWIPILNTYAVFMASDYDGYSFIAFDIDGLSDGDQGIVEGSISMDPTETWNADVLWAFESGGNVYTSNPMVEGEVVYMWLYNLSSGNAQLYAFDINGLFNADDVTRNIIDTDLVGMADRIWEWECPAFFNTPPAYGDGRLYIGAYTDSPNQNIFAFDADPSDMVDEGVIDPPGSSYDVLWTNSLDDGMWGAPNFDNGRLYIATDDSGGSSLNNVFCLNASDGNIIWQTHEPNNGRIQAAPAYWNDRMYVVTWGGGSWLYCYDATPEDGTDEGYDDPPTAQYDLIWQYDVPGTPRGQPAVSDNKVYLATRSQFNWGALICLDAIGDGLGSSSEIWNYYDNDDDFYAGPAIANGYVFQTAFGGKVYKFGVPTIPDVAVFHEDIIFDPETPGENNTWVDITVRVSNLADQNAANVLLRLIIDEDDNGQYDLGDTIVYNATIPIVEGYREVLVTVPWFGSPVDYYNFLAEVDPLDTIQERNENNNLAWNFYAVDVFATVDYIIINDTAGGGGNWVGDRTYSPSDTDTFYAHGFNYTEGYIGDVEVTWASNDPVVATVVAGPSSSTTFTAVAPGDCKVNATFVNDPSIINETGNLHVTDWTIDYIVIVDSEGTGINVIPDQTIPVSTTLQGWAAAFNNSGGYIGDISVTWSVNNTGSSATTNPFSGTNSTFDSDTNPGTAVWMADDGLGHNDTVVFTITTFTVDYILIVDSADTGAAEIPDQTVDAGFTIQGWAAAFNNTGGGYLGDIYALWTVFNLAGANANTTPSSGTNSTFDAGNSGGQATWTAEDGQGHSDSVVFNITAPTIDYIVIVDSGGSGSDEIPDQTVDVGFSIAGWAAEFNNSVGYISDAFVTWDVITSDTTATTFPLAGFTSTFDSGDSGGTATWTASDGSGHVDTVIFTVNPPVVDYITIVDSGDTGVTEIPDQTVGVGVTIDGWAAAFNNTISYISDIPVSWYVSNVGSSASTAPSSGENSTFDSGMNQGTATWIANDGEGHMDTVEFTVNSPVLDYIIIVDSGGTGITEIPDQIVGVGYTITGWAAGFNDTVGYIGDVSVDWSVNNVGSSASTDPTSGFSSKFDAGLDPGTVTWEANDGAGHIDQVIFTINPATVDYILIVTDQGTGTGEIPDQSVGVGFTIQGWAAAFNATIGYLNDVTATWSVSTSGGATASTFPPAGTSSVFNASFNPGIAIWEAVDSEDNNDTVVFTILPPTADYILIVSSPDPGAAEIPDQTVDVGSTITGYAAAFNDTVGYFGDITVNWSVTNVSSNASTSPASGLSSTFYSGWYGGTCTWIADDGSGHMDTVSFTINAPDVDYILIVNTENSGSTEIPDKTVDVGFIISGWAASFNNTVGFIGDITVSWSVSNSGSNGTSEPSSGTNSSFYSGWFGGTATWIASDGSGLSDSVAFTVNPPEIDFILIVDAPDGGGTEILDKTIDVGETHTGWAAGFNNTVSYVDDISVTWNVDNTDSSASTTPLFGTNSSFYAGIVEGSAILTADDGQGNTDTVVFTINPPTVDYISFRDAPDGGGNVIDDPSYPVGAQFRFYAVLFNVTSGFIANAPNTTVWDSDDEAIISLSSIGEYTDIQCSDEEHGTVLISVDDQDGHTNSTTATVLEPTVDQLRIMDAPGSGGTEITDMLYPVGAEDIFYGVMFNETAGFLGNVPNSATWSSNRARVEVISPGSSTEITCSDTDYGTARVTLEDGQGHEAWVDVEILPPAMDYIQLQDDSGSQGNILVDHSIAGGASETYFAVAYNDTAGYIGAVDVDWLSTNPSVGSLSDSSGSDTTFTASSSGTGTTTINVGYQENLTGSFIVTVNDEADPIADAGSDQTIKAGGIVQFDGTGSEDNVGIESYEWTFSDGDNTLTLDGDKVEYIFEEPGSYEITLEVTDTSGNWDRDSFIVIVEEEEKEGEADLAWLTWLILLIVLVIIILIILFLFTGKKKGKGICKVCGRDIYPQSEEEAAAGVCPVCKAKETAPAPVEAIVEEVEPTETEEAAEPIPPPPPAPSEEELLQTVQCPSCEKEFSAKSKTPGLMAVTCPNCGTKGEIEF